MRDPIASIRVGVLTVGLVWLIFLATCGGTTIARFQPEIRNLTDTFEFQVTNAQNVSQNLQYDWENTGTSADINQACILQGGSAQLMIRDAQGTVVYTRNLADNGTFLTNAGQAGTWKIQVALSGLDGTINFRAQKHTP